MQLDLTLARLMLGVIGVAAALMLFVIASLMRSGLPGVRHWFLANVCATLGMMLLTARGHIPDLLSIPLANALMAAGAFLLVGGTRRFFGLAPIWRIGLASTTLFTALLCWFTWVQPSFDVRVALSSVLHAGATLWLTLTLYRGRRTVSSPYSGQYCVAVAGLETLLHLTRGALYLVSAHPHRAFESSILNLGWFAIGTLAMPALTMGLVMLAHDRLRSQIERQLNFDELTGAASRRAFLRQAQHELTQARRSG